MQQFSSRSIRINTDTKTMIKPKMNKSHSPRINKLYLRTIEG